MKLALATLGLLLCGVALKGQEVVVFDSSRSLLIQSHRQDGEWVYLKIASGEMAVRPQSILKIVKEGVVAPAETATDGSGSKGAESTEASQATTRKRESQPSESGEAPPPRPRLDPAKEAALSRPLGPPGRQVQKPAPGPTSYQPMTLKGGDLKNGGVVAERRQRVVPPTSPGASDAKPGG